MKRVGYIDSVPVYKDPSAPPGMMYFINDKSMTVKLKRKRRIMPLWKSKTQNN